MPVQRIRFTENSNIIFGEKLEKRNIGDFAEKDSGKSTKGMKAAV